MKRKISGFTDGLEISPKDNPAVIQVYPDFQCNACENLISKDNKAICKVYDKILYEYDDEKNKVYYTDYGILMCFYKCKHFKEDKQCQQER